MILCSDTTVHMRILLTIVACLLTVPASAQSLYQWVPGLDIQVPAYSDVDKEGRPLPPNARLGYDQTTHFTSLLYIADQCTISWITRPEPGHGAIIDIFQVGVPGTPHVWAYYHESGLIRVEPQPVAYFCEPLPRRQ